MIDTIMCGDSIENMRKLENESIDLIFADPPYWMRTSGALERVDGTEFDGCNDEWDKFLSLEQYENFTREWLSECRRILKKNGSIWVIGGMQCIYTIGSIMTQLGFWIINDVVWYKTNPTPSILRVNYLSSTEFIFIGSKGQKQWTFNYSVPQEMHNFFETANSSVYGETTHPTEKPISLMEHFIRIHTNENDTVLDCFMGSGTTGVAAVNLRRKFIGIEKNAEYFNIAKERIDNVLNSRPQYIKVNNMRQNTFEEI